MSKAGSGNSSLGTIMTELALEIAGANKDTKLRSGVWNRFNFSGNMSTGHLNTINAMIM